MDGFAGKISAAITGTCTVAGTALAYLQWAGVEFDGFISAVGNRNKKTADKIAKERFAEFQRIQDASYENDFEKMAKGKLSSGGK